MDTLLKDLKYQFKKPDNGLIKVILINVVVYVILGTLWVLTEITGFNAIFDFIYYQFKLPANITEFLHRPWTLFTYFFAHDQHILHIFHIIFNMLTLYWFGNVISEFVGNRRFINLYILGGLFGGLIFLLMFNTIPYYIARSGVLLIGSSGAVFAVVVAAATLVPNYTFFLFLFGPVRIIYIAAFVILLSFLGMAGNGNMGGNICHLGGALFGYIYIKQLQRGIDLGKPINIIARWISNIGKPKMKVSYRNKDSKATPANTEPTQAEIDAILDKISRSGYESLSKDEKQKLFKASQK